MVDGWNGNGNLDVIDDHDNHGINSMQNEQYISHSFFKPLRWRLSQPGPKENHLFQTVWLVFMVWPAG